MVRNKLADMDVRLEDMSDACLETKMMTSA
jgi:hypothetical protein